MNKTIPVVRKLQSDAIDQDMDVSSMLRTAKVIATKLELQDALEWIDAELNGYMGVPTDGLPSYRRLSGDLRGLNPYHGWQPVLFEDPELTRMCSEAPIGTSIGAIEEELKAGKEQTGSRTFMYGIAPEAKAALMSAMDYPTDIQIRLSYGAVYSVVDAVRNLILNWSLELEAAGILGEDMEFSQHDKVEAVPVTQQFFAQNIGLVGNVTDNAQVSNQQTASTNVSLDLESLQNIVDQARAAIALLPTDTRGALEPKLEDLARELGDDTPSPIKIRSLLQSVKTICEGASGNLAAQGILGILTNVI